MAKAKNKIKVSFVGTNATEVTGSMTLITLPDEEKTQVLIECGLYQSNETISNVYKKNSRTFNFKPKNIKYIFLAHSHVDHIGLLGRLYKEGCTAKIICPNGNYEISKLLMLDTAYIFRREITYVSKQLKHKCELIYDVDDVYTTLSYWNEYPFDQKIVLDDNFSFRFTSSSHILNSAQIELWVSYGGRINKILYTSDLGNISIKNNFVSEFNRVEKCNLLIGETTYSDFTERKITEKDRNKDLEKLESIIRETCVIKKGKVLIPTFANARTQQLLMVLYKIFGKDESFKTLVLIDSPMAVKITKEYAQLLSGEEKELYIKALTWKNLKLVEDYNDSLYYQERREPMVVLSSSGMCTAGRSLTWLKRLIQLPHNHIFKVGYALEGTIMWKIKNDSSSHVTLERKKYANKAKLTELRSFSSHMQYNDLIDYYSAVHSDKICLVHGEMGKKLPFATRLQQELSKKNKTTKVIPVSSSTEILL